VNDLIVTTVPYHCSKEQKSVWRQRGNQWLVLHHVPPRTYPGSTDEEPEAAELLSSYRPEYFISGRSHQFPYFPGSSWAQRTNGLNVLVPGKLLSAPFPNHIIVNTESGEAGWETSSREWIAEEGLHDHLVFEVPAGWAWVARRMCVKYGTLVSGWPHGFRRRRKATSYGC